MSDTTEPVITERDLPAPPPEVWENIIAPDRLATWLGATIEIGESDGAPLAPGDEGTIRFDEIDDESFVLVEEVEAERRLAFRWATTSDAPTEVLIELTPTPGGTRIRIVEQTLPSGTLSRHVATSHAMATARSLTP